MEEQQAYQELKKRLSDRNWRLNNLYWITNKNSKVEKFKMNWFQKYLFDNLWFLNIILKARQLGISTFIEIFILDACLFNSNTQAGIIDATLDDAKKKLSKIKFAYDKLPEDLKNERKLLIDNTQELKFSNGSGINADTTFRGSTVQILHISEYAKICKKDPIKANEIKNGALNAIGLGQLIFIESTAEDGEGYFYEYCQKAEKLQIEKQELTKLDFKFFFFPWWQDPEYKLEFNDFIFSSESKKYFESLEAQGMDLTEAQKVFYVKKKEQLGEDIKKEYPSTSKEAFEIADEDKYYKELILKLRAKNQVCEFDIVKGIEVDLDLDLGRSDYTSIIFSQRVGKEIRIVDYLEGMGEHISYYINEIKKKEYLIGKCWLPHDANNETLSAEKTTYAYMVEAFGRLHVDVVDKLGIDLGINEVRNILPNCWFRQSISEVLLEHLEKYSKKWNEVLGQYIGQKHDEHSHAADAMRGLAVRYKEKKVVKENNSKSQTMIKKKPRF